MHTFYVIAMLPEYSSQPRHYFNGAEMSDDWRKARFFMSVEVAALEAAQLGMVVDIIEVKVAIGEHMGRVTPPVLQRPKRA